MSTRDFDLFVIGGGSGGVRCARIAAGHGARVGVAEGRFWGGTCVNIGCVPKKFMVMAAEYRGQIEDARAFGWQEAAAGEHDWATLIAAKDAEVSRLSGLYKKLLEGAKATAFEANARLLDAHTIEMDGKRVTAETIVIATGGKPSPADIPGGERAIVSDDIFRLAARPRRIAIVGAGYIALEFAGIFAGLGSETHLVYRQPLPLRGFDEDIRTASAAALEAHGIVLHPAVTPTAIEDAGGGARRLLLSDGSAIEADAVLLATGRHPATRDLGLDRAGVRTAPSGAILVDTMLATSAPNIFAIGDVTDRLNLTPVATAEGHALADTLFGGRPRGVSLETVPTAVFSTPPIATVGLTEEEAAARGVVRVFVSAFAPMRHTISKRPRRTLMKLIADAATDRVLGIHMMGEDAPEIMQGFAVAMVAGATKADFDRTIGIHPTAAEEFVTLRTETRRVGLGGEAPAGAARGPAAE